MLIEISDEFERVDIESNERFLVCLNTLLDVSRKGKHFIFAKRNTLMLLSKCVALSEAARSTANRLSSKYAELAALKKIIREKVLVSAGVEGVLKVDNFTWIVGADVIANGVIAGSSLVAEDSDDGWLYRQSGSHYMVANRITGVTLSLSVFGGGGNSTSDQFEAILRERERFCLCITDSDRNAPVAEVKETARQCQKVGEKYSWPGLHLALDCRELENLIPLSWYSECVPPEAEARFSELVTIVRALGIDVMRFCDIKEGLKYSKINSMGMGSPGSVFWMEFVRKKIVEFGNVCNCGNPVLDEDDQLTNCDCYAVPPLGKSALRWLIDHWQHDGHPQRLLKTAQRDVALAEWVDIGRRVFEWGLALPPMRA